MSLDVYLEEDTLCPHCKGVIGTTQDYWANVTHNLNKMAGAAGIYEQLWRPDEIGITKAKELVKPLTKGLKKLKENPRKFEDLNPENGWGSYHGLVKFVEDYLEACKANPEAIVRISR